MTPGLGVRYCAFVFLGLVCSPGVASSQAMSAHAIHAAETSALSTEMLAFVATARAGTERYQDRDAAIAAGFRRVGLDFPSMGEHWINPGKIFTGKFDPADPAMLTYATIAGKVRLLGAVYAIPLSAGEKPPTLPDGIDRWHEHNGTVDEESMLPEHHSGRSSPDTMSRLAILHLWLWIPASPGVFAADNWTLPFIRAGLDAPTDAGDWTGAARALSLVSGGDEFYLGLLRDQSADGRVSPEQMTLMKTAIDRVTRVLVRVRPSSSVPRDALVELGATWNDLARATGLHPAADPR